MHPKALKEELFKRLSVGLAEYGFVFARKQREFHKNTPSGRWCFRVGFVSFPGVFDVVASVAIRIDALENLIDDQTGQIRDVTRWSLGTELGCINDSKQRWTVFQLQDVAAVSDGVLAAFVNIGLPFLQKYSDIQNTFEILGWDDAVAMRYNGMFEGRAMRALGLAFLMGKTELLRKLAEEKTAFLRKHNAVGLESFLNFKRKLESRLAESGDYSPSKSFESVAPEEGQRDGRSLVSSPASIHKYPVSLVSAPLFTSIAIIGRANPPLWFYEKWLSIVAALGPLVNAIDQEIVVRTSQIDEHRKAVRPGPLGWNERSHRKWTHSSPDTKESSSGWRFMLGEVWAPSWRVCQRRGCTPDLFISLENPHILDPPSPGQFNQFLHLALPVRFFQQHRQLATLAVEQTARLLDSVLSIMRIVPWEASGDSIQDTLTNHVHYTGMEKDLVPDLSRLSGGWMPYDPEQITVQTTQ